MRQIILVNYTCETSQNQAAQEDCWKQLVWKDEKKGPLVSSAYALNSSLLWTDQRRWLASYMRQGRRRGVYIKL